MNFLPSNEEFDLIFLFISFDSFNFLFGIVNNYLFQKKSKFEFLKIYPLYIRFIKLKIWIEN